MSQPNKSELIDEVLDGLAVNPRISDDPRDEYLVRQAKATILKAFREVEIEGRVDELNHWFKLIEINNASVPIKVDLVKAIKIRLKQLAELTNLRRQR